MKKSICLIIFLFSWFFCLSCSAQASSLNRDLVTLIDNWVYQWGDEKIQPTAKWNKWSFQKGHLEVSSESKYLWLKVNLPNQRKWDNPVLYFYAILAQQVDVYLDNKLIYQVSSNDNSLNNELIKKTVIPLPENWADKTLYLRLDKGKNSYIGLYGIIFLGLHKEILAHIFQYQFDHILLGFCFFIFVLLMLAISFFIKEKKQKRTIYSLLCFIFLAGVWNISQYDNIDLIFPFSSYCSYLGNVCAFLAPIAGLYFFEQIFGSGPYNLIRRLWQFHFVYLIPYVFLSLWDLFSFNKLIYNILLVCYSWSIIRLLLVIYSLGPLILISYYWYKNNNLTDDKKLEIRILAVGITILILSIIHFQYDVVGWGFFFFIICLILILANQFVRINDVLKEYAVELQKKNKLLQQWNENLEKIVIEKTESLSSLLNNIEQGFFSFGKELVIDFDYSEQCNELFGKKINGLSVIDVLFPLVDCVDEEKNFFQSLLKNIFLNQNEQKKYLDLLPDQFVINDKYIHLKYKLFTMKKQIKILVTITDVTEKIQLERKVEEEKNNLQMVIKAFSNYNEFQNTVKQFQDFWHYQLNYLFSSDYDKEKILKKLEEQIKLFKNSFSKLQISSMVAQLNWLELKLIYWQKKEKNVSLKEIKSFFYNSHLLRTLEQIIILLKSALGEKFFSGQEKVMIKKEKLKEFEEKIANLFSVEQYNFLLPEVRKLLFKPFQELLVGYSEYVEKVADDLGKSVKPLQIQGEEVLVDLEKYSGFVSSLVHIFHNIIDHGIEEPEKRILAQKEQYGTIFCQLKKNSGYCVLTIVDDGKGIDLEEIKEKALKKGLIDKHNFVVFSEEEILALLFRDGFSTSVKVNKISGRGVGLAAVKEEVDKLQGKVFIKSKKGKGTEFTFLFPLEEGKSFSLRRGHIDGKDSHC